MTIELHIGNSLQVARATLDGDADLGFVEGDIDEPLLVQIPVAVDQLVVVVGTSHALAAPNAVEFNQILAARWVLREKGSGTRQVFEDALRRSGFDPARLDVVMELPSNEAVSGVVEAGGGVTALSRLVVADKLAAGKLVELPFGYSGRRYVALRHGDRHRGRSESALLDMMRQAPARKPRSGQ